MLSSTDESPAKDGGASAAIEEAVFKFFRAKLLISPDSGKMDIR
jgi:hypothetical protein